MKKQTELVIAENYVTSAVDFANQGNNVLGIREAGKTYTAMKVAEQLLLCNIPIIVYDPIGIWKNLKIGVDGNKGFPIVVAGGEGSDIILNEKNAVDIVKAAMKENISLVIDLYSPELSNKAKWIRIVQETVDELMYHNKSYGLRHIFIEEAAEFIPQRLQPQHAKVYSSIERLARMGRNAMLGYTLINQRAEEVNKAILEISAVSLLHKQVGKNSLKSIQQWLELRQVENSQEIIKSLPSLGQGECWVIGVNDNPHRIKVLPKQTLHPDPKKGVVAISSKSATAVDVTGFVSKMNEILAQPPAQESKATVVDDSMVRMLKADLARAKSERDVAMGMVVQLKNHLIESKEVMQSAMRGVEDSLSPLSKFLRALPADYIRMTPADLHGRSDSHDVPIGRGRMTKNTEIVVSDFPVQQSNIKKVSLEGNGALRIIRVLAMYHPYSITKTRVGTIAGLSPKGGSFNTYISTLKKNNYIIVEKNNYLAATQEGIEYAGPVTPVPVKGEEVLKFWLGIIGVNNGAGKILSVIVSAYPNTVSRATIGVKCNLVTSGGSFNTYISTLKRNGLIESPASGVFKASDEFK